MSKQQTAADRDAIRAAFSHINPRFTERLIAEGATLAMAMKAPGLVTYKDEPGSWDKIIARVNAKFDAENPHAE